MKAKGANDEWDRLVGFSKLYGSNLLGLHS